MNETEYLWDFAQRLRLLPAPDFGGPEGNDPFPPGGRDMGRRLADMLDEIGRAERYFVHGGAPTCRETARRRFRLLGLKLRDIAPLAIVGQMSDADARAGAMMTRDVESVAEELAGSFEELAAMFPTETPPGETPPASAPIAVAIPFAARQARVTVLADGLRVEREDGGAPRDGREGPAAITVPIASSANRLLRFLAAWAREDRRVSAREHHRLRIGRKNYARLSEEIERMTWDYFRRTISAANRLLAFSDNTVLFIRLRADASTYVASCSWGDSGESSVELGRRTV